MSLELTYVALSRLKNFKDFLIKPFTNERSQKLSQSKSLKARLDEGLRLVTTNVFIIKPLSLK
jgi:hypothetical protein